MADPLGIGQDLHPRLDRARAGRREDARAGDLDDADPTDVDRGEALEVAQRRGVDALGATGVEDRRAGRHADGLAVDGQLDARDLGRGRRLGWLARTRRRSEQDRVDRHRPTISGCRNALSMALLAVWPRPQIEASRIAWPTSGGGPAHRPPSRAAARWPGGPGSPPGGRHRPGRGRIARTTRRGRTRRSGAGVPTRSTVSSKTITTPEPRVAPIARVPSKVSGVSSASGADEDARRAAEQDRLDRPTAGHPAAELEQLAQGRPERDLVDARPDDVAGQAEQLWPGRALRADRRERRPAVEDDRRDVDQGLDVVDRGRLAEQPDLDRERRLVARLAALALDRFEERGLLAADVGAGAAPELDVEARSPDPRMSAPEQAARRGPGSIAFASRASASGYSPRM